MNIKVVLEYDGKSFAGWQQQRRAVLPTHGEVSPNATDGRAVLPIYGEVSPRPREGRRTVEEELKRALRSIVGKDVMVYAAGRTDAGAHAEGQVANFQTDGRIAPHRLMAALNARLPDDVAVISAAVVEDDFHARYSARWRRYRYRYLDRPARPALERGRCWHVRGLLDVDEMSRAAMALKGKHDWTSFCSPSEPADGRVREMRSATVSRRGEFVELELVAEGFLRGMVRSIAGAL